MRIFHLNDHIGPNPNEATKSIIASSTEANVVGWYLLPGQEVPLHIHPHGQDTWIVMSGEADYVQEGGETRRLRAGDITIAAAGQVHGARNVGSEPFVFVGVVTPAAAGFEAVTA